MAMQNWLFMKDDEAVPAAAADKVAFGESAEVKDLERGGSNMESKELSKRDDPTQRQNSSDSDDLDGEEIEHPSNASDLENK